MFEPLSKTIAESPWLFAPAAAVFVFAGILHFWFRRPGNNSRRRALLFGVGTVAVLASAVFAAFVWTFARLLMRGSWSFDAVWILGAFGAGALTLWLWLRFYRILRQT
jgi:hypothetical protein